MGGHEIDRIGRGPLRGDHQITIILAILMIDKDEHMAIARLIEDLFDWRDCIGPIALDRTRLFENLCHGHPLAGLLAAR